MWLTIEVQDKYMCVEASTGYHLVICSWSLPESGLLMLSLGGRAQVSSVSEQGFIEVAFVSAVWS